MKDAKVMSNGEITKEILEFLKGQKDEKVVEVVNELLTRYDHALGCLEQPNLYYREKVSDFVKGRTTRLEKL